MFIKERRLIGYNETLNGPVGPDMSLGRPKKDPPNKPGGPSSFPFQDIRIGQSASEKPKPILDFFVLRQVKLILICTCCFTACLVD